MVGCSQLWPAVVGCVRGQCGYGLPPAVLYAPMVATGCGRPQGTAGYCSPAVLCAPMVVPRCGQLRWLRTDANGDICGQLRGQLWSAAASCGQLWSAVPAWPMWIRAATCGALRPDGGARCGQPRWLRTAANEDICGQLRGQLWTAAAGCGRLGSAVPAWPMWIGTATCGALRSYGGSRLWPAARYGDMRLAVAECGQQWPAVVSLDIVARCGQGLPPTALCASMVVTCRGQLRVAVAHAVSGHQLRSAVDTYDRMQRAATCGALRSERGDPLRPAAGG